MSRVPGGEQAPPPAPQFISHYRVVRELGRGGMGVVYLAEDTLLGRQVAIKFLSGESAADPHARGRLIEEARAAAKLEHPNICTVHEVGEGAGRVFVVMEYVEGETLGNRIRNGPLGFGECLEVAAQVADALSEAHARGVIHRDVSPQNIMLTARGRAVVMDFGLAKVIRGRVPVDSEAVTESLLPAPGEVAGTLPYMSPEQLRGEAVDARGDIFSLGAVLYEMLTGRRAFAAGSAAETISAVMTGEPGPLARHSRGVPAELERIVAKALRKDQGERYQTARDLLLDLRSLKHRLELEEELGRSDPPGTAGLKEHGADTAADPATGGGRLAAQPAAAAAAPRGGVKRYRRGLLIMAAALLAVTATLSYLFYPQAGGRTIDSIVVLPLVNAGGDSETEILSDGITESLINSLSQVRQLKVMARATAFRYKGKEVDPRRVGRELGVGAVLTGRLIRRGERLDIQVELVETGEGAQLWGGQYDREASDLLSVRQELAREIAGRLRLRLGGEDERRLASGDAANTEAYEFYLRGRHFWNKRTAGGMKKAIEQFQQAIDLDPTYALAYVGLADSYLLLEEYARTPAGETLPKARAAVERALQLDDSLAEAHASLGVIEQHSWNVSEAEREFKRAIELNPTYPTAHHWYGVYLRNTGRFDEAMAEIRTAQRLDPLSPVIAINVAAIYECKGEWDATIEEAKKVIELDPNFPHGHSMLGVAYRMQGRCAESIAEFERAAELSGRPFLSLSGRGLCYAATGNRAGAREILKELQELYERREALGQDVASLYAALGEKDQAFAWLEKDFKTRSGFLSQISFGAGGATLRDALGGDPRWDDLLRRIGLPRN